MSREDVYGPVLDDAIIEDAWLALALRWVDTYLVAAERAAGDAPRTYARPGHWRLDDVLRLETEDVTPLLVCASAGEPEPPADDRGIIVSKLRVGLGLYYRAAQMEEAHVAVRRYGWALAALAEHKAGELGGICQLLTRPRKTYDEGGIRNSQDALGVAYVSFDVLAETRSRGGGPDEPIDPGTDAPADPDTPVVVDTEVLVDSLDAQ